MATELQSTMTQRGTCLPAPVSEKKVLKASLAGFCDF